MKTRLLSSILALLVTAGMSLKAQDRADEYLGLPGDNLNLYAVMNLFQESETLEAFERNLNDENSRINNLDLNGDNYVDYISVNDYPNGNVHTIVLQVALNQREKQDVAVFTVERMKNGDVQIQLIGDEALYGRNYIIEPYYAETPNPGYSGTARPAARTTYVYVSAWPVVRYIYQPHYVVWRSSWYWGYYPHWYHTWSPFYWHHYHGYHSHFYDHYYAHYRHWHTPRWNGYHSHYYSSVRIASPTVVININKGNYRQTYSRPETRADGDRMYARVQATRNSNASNGTTRRSSVSETSSTGSRSREATSSTTRRAPASTASRSSSQTSRETVRSSSGSRSAASGSEGRSTVRSSSESRSTARPASSESRSTARPASSESRSTARPASSESRSTARPASSESRSTARPASTQTRTTEARSSSSQTRSTAARSSAPSQSRTATARSSGSSSGRSTVARSSSAPRQQSASAPRSSSRQSSPAAKSSKSSSSSRTAGNDRSRR